jgi:outer membrane receptor protein involved in Fe transport
MKRHTQTSVIGMLFFGSILAASLSAQTVATPTAATQAPPPAAPRMTSTTAVGTEEEQVVKLSPFEVSTTRNVGYQATDTLAGTRIRTDLKDVGASISVLTKEFLEDIGATNSASLLEYTPNAQTAGVLGTYAGVGNATSVDESGNLRAPASAQRLRGLAAADNARDFYITDIPWDSYNVDRVDILRGPNSILYGLGSPAGIVNNSTRSADFNGNRGEVQARTGSWGSNRASIDLNQQLLPNVLAIRVDGMWNDEKYEQKPAFQNDKRLYGALRFDPQLFKNRSRRSGSTARSTTTGRAPSHRTTTSRLGSARTRSPRPIPSAAWEKRSSTMSMTCGARTTSPRPIKGVRGIRPRSTSNHISPTLPTSSSLSGSSTARPTRPSGLMADTSIPARAIASAGIPPPRMASWASAGTECSWASPTWSVR